MSGSSLTEKATSSFLWKLLERGGYQGIQFVVQIILARLLSPADFGALAIIVVFVNLANVFVQSGFNTAIIQAKEIDDDDCSSVFWFSMAISVVLFAALFAFAPVIALFYHFDSIVNPLRALGVVLFVNSYNSVQTALASRSLDFKKIFYSTLFAVVVSGCIAIVLAYLGFGLWSLVVQAFLYQMASCIALAFMVSWRPRFVFNAKRVFELFGFGWKICATSIIDTLYLNAYDLVVGKVFSPAILGLFSQGKKFPNTVNALVDGSLQSVMLSFTSRINDDLDKVRSSMRTTLIASSYTVSLLMGMLAFSAPVFIPLLLSEKWSEAVPFLQIFCLYYALQPLQTTNIQVVSALGRSDMILKNAIAKRTFGLAVLLFCAVLINNIYIVAVGAIIDAAVCVVINARPAGKLLGYGLFEQLRDFLPGLTLSAVLFSILYYLLNMFFLGVAGMFFGLICYLILFLVISRVLKFEGLKIVLGFMNVIKRRQ